MDVVVVSILAAATVALLVTERIPVDLTAIGLMVALAASGILTPVEAVAGFANPAVVTVGAMFLLSAGMTRTGAVAFVGRAVLRASRGSPRRAMVLATGIAAVASAFINNTPIVVLFIPIVMTLACEYGTPPSKLLIPLSYASILGGTCTLIGTSTNIILSDLSAAAGLGELSMFELAPLGVPLAVAGIAFLCLAAPRLLPGHAAPTCETEDRKDRRYLAELLVTEGSALVGADPFSALPERFPGFEVYEVVRAGQILHRDEAPVAAAAGDVVLAKGSPSQFVALLRRDAALPHGLGGRTVSRSGADHVVAELIIPPLSRFLGERLVETDLAREPDLDVVAVRRRGVHYGEQRMGSLRVRVGTILLVQCSPSRLEALRASPEVIVVEEVHREIVDRDRAWRAIAIFAAVVLAATVAGLDIMVAALGGAFLMVVTGCVSLRDGYRAVQGQVLLLVVGTIALGAAMERTGAARLYAEQAISLLGDASPAVLLSGLILLTTLATQVLSNNATAVLLFPVAVSAAQSLGVEPRPFVVGLCFGASACFATPMAYQTNLLVYGPGGYRSTDFLKLGLPLSLLVWLGASLLIPLIWPF